MGPTIGMAITMAKPKLIRESAIFMGATPSPLNWGLSRLRALPDFAYVFCYFGSNPGRLAHIASSPPGEAREGEGRERAGS